MSALLLDEANILIEQLKEQLKSTQNEKERDKKKYAQQLQFMESENGDLQKKLIEWNERYYDDKKKWSSQVRALETELETLRTAKVAKESTLPETRALHTDWDEKFKILENTCILKSREVSRLVKQNLLLENTIAEMSSVQSNTNDAVQDQENAGSYKEELRSLRRENEELRQSVRKLKKSDDKNTQQLKNQQLLELEISNCKSKMKSLDDVIAKYKVTEKQYHGVLEERAELSEAFHRLLTDCSGGSNAAQAGSTPVKPTSGSDRIVVSDIIGAYKKYQSSYALLMREVTDLKCTVTKLTAANQMLEGKGYGFSSGGKDSTADKDGAAAQSQLKRVQQKNELLNQQVILCTAENTRLRSAMLAYDEEFEMIVKKINKVNTSRGASGEEGANIVAPDILKLKNNVIEGLNETLSTHRDVIGKELGLSLPPVPDASGKKRKLDGAQESSSVDNSTADAAAAEATSVALKEKDAVIADLRQEESALRAELYVFQRKCGTDVFPFTVDGAGGADSSGSAGESSMGITPASSHDAAFASCSSSTRVLHMKVNPFSEAYGPLVVMGAPGKAKQVLYNNSLNPADPTYWLRVAQTNAAMKLNIDDTGRPISISGTGGSSDAPKPVNTSGDELGSNSNSSMMMDASMIAGAHNTSTMAGGVDPAKMNQRLKAIFKEKIAQFREVVYLLSGYKVDVIAADSYSASHKQMIRLRSMYAEDAEDFLLFQWDGVDKLELCESEFVHKVDPKILSYLQTSGSIPSFLANVTSELFEKQTMI